MGLIKSLIDVRAQDARVTRARQRLPAVAETYVARARRYPLAWVGAAFAAGYVMERLPIRPWRIPGVIALLSGEGVELVHHLLASFGIDSGVDSPTP